MSSAAVELTHSHTQSRGLFSQSHFMVLLLPIYGNQSRKQMLQPTFQKHPEKCKQRFVSACLGGKGCSANYRGLDRTTASRRVFTHTRWNLFLRMAWTPFNSILFNKVVLFPIITAIRKSKLNLRMDIIRLKLHKRQRKRHQLKSALQTNFIIFNLQKRQTREERFPLAPLSNKVALSAGPNNLWTRVGAARKKRSTWR